MGVSLWEDKVKDLRREKVELDSVCELKFLSNSVEMSACQGSLLTLKRDCFKPFPSDILKLMQTVVYSIKRKQHINGNTKA